MLRLNLTAWGQLDMRDMANAMAGIELGHEWIVQCFASLTRRKMHQKWESTR